MFNYTKSALSETFDFLKRLIYIFQISIQFIYIAYIVYRLTDSTSNKIGNGILLVLSVGYLMFQIFTTREFYTNKFIVVKKRVKNVFKVTKYLVNTYIIILAVILLLNGHAKNENATMLITILMILGVLFSMVFDILIALIDRQIIFIKTALAYDIEKFKSKRKLAVMAISKLGIDLDQEFPTLSNKKNVDKVEKVKQKQEHKKIRKLDFLERIKAKATKTPPQPPQDPAK